MKTKGKSSNHLLKTVVLSGSVFVLVFLFFSLVYLNKTFPKTYFAGIDISGKNREQVSNIVTNYIKSKQEQKIKILAGNEVIELDLNNLGVTFDLDSCLSKIVNTYRAKSPKDLAYNFITAPFETRNITPVYKIDFSLLGSVLDSRVKTIEKRAVTSTIVFEGGLPKILNDEKGLIVDRNRLTRDLTRRLESFDDSVIVASYVEDEPRVKANNSVAALKKVQELNDQQITLTYEFDKWSLGEDNLLSVLTFYPQDDNDSLMKLNWGSQPIEVIDVSYQGKMDGSLEVKLNDDSLNSFIYEIAREIDKPRVDASLEFDGVKVSKFTSAQDGRSVDKAKVKNLILDIVSIDKLQMEKNVVISLPVEVNKAKIANQEINSLGIKELIASGVSYFAGSIANRAFNIGLGSELINGTVVPPGEVFSFNKLVGPVSKDQGFKEAYVISKGRTVLDDGGGICQVSTTVFRAALNAGLPIAERTAHAYRVSYYEQQGFEPGFDATIWSPTVDLKFKNDTNYHILVQATVNKGQSKLQIDIYGTRDNRRVEITDPVLTNRKSAPEPKYEDDPGLPVGTTKQVDFAAEGLTSVFTRKVFKGNELVIDDTFKSVFRPWQAVYLVGKGG